MKNIVKIVMLKLNSKYYKKIYRQVYLLKQIIDNL